MAPDGPAIEFDGVDFSYDGRHLVLEDVTLEIARGDFVSVIGPNGGGKTTLLKLALGLLGPDRGTVRILGTGPRHARPRIGSMPQHATTDPRFPITVVDVVLMGRLGPGLLGSGYDDGDRHAADAALEQVGLGGAGRKPFSSLSGGQRQRALLARALASDPELLLLDEPAAGLDRKVELDLFDLLRELNRTKTVVLVSHDLGFVSEMVRTVVCVHRRVDVHPISELDGGMIRDLYGGEVRLVHHDRRI